MDRYLISPSVETKRSGHVLKGFVNQYSMLFFNCFGHLLEELIKW